jgi:hypothetical protein
VVVILVLEIIFLWSKIKSNPKSNSKTSEIDITKADGTFFKPTSLSGRVLVWQPQTKPVKEQLNDSGETKDYVIEPSVLTLIIPAGKHSGSGPQLHI